MEERISVRVPATSANLGCAFDCAALALNLYVDIHVTPRVDHAVTIRYTGVTPERISTSSDNLVARTIWNTLEAWNKVRGFDLEIENQIPVGVGLGSSAAAIVGSLAVCHLIANRPLWDAELLTLATRLEGHPDNAAAAWHGGFTVALEEGGRTISCSCPVPDSVHIILVVPNYPLRTEEARAVLPAEYSRADAVHNLQRAVALAAHFFSARPEFRRSFFEDHWHQPYRAALVPGLTAVLEHTHPDLQGVCLSGAGPSVLAFARASAEAIGEEIRQLLAQHGVESEVRCLSADNLGAKGWNRIEGIGTGNRG